MKKFFEKIVDGIKKVANKIKEFFSNHKEEVIVGATVASMAVITGCYVHYSKQAYNLRKASSENAEIARAHIEEAFRIADKYRDLEACSLVRVFGETEPTKQVDIATPFYTDPRLFVCPDRNENFIGMENVPVSDMGIFGENLQKMAGGPITNLEHMFAVFSY